ncbi:DUF3971 domain-containing protein [Aliiroseovarius subalbicans]|uniref:YhdP family protein n=1 Tax=Aliiroseovarius subalbicans TaxID=2925840 RepID=UPI001F5A1AF2|nr:DUF3971 domain-containing protein [Aliiroseovarius subalbicans]MCI2398495.1 hypothetical protein [Aliiroseovarius subalbicans]
MSDTPPPKPKRRIRRLHWHLGFWMLLSIALMALFLVLSSMSLTGRVITTPDWVRDRVEDQLNARLGHASISLERVELGVTPKGRPNVRFVNVGIRDNTGLEVAQLNGVEGGIKPGPLLRGRLEPSKLYLSGAQVTLRRRANGEFDLSFGQAGGASGDLASVLDAIDGVFTDGPLSKADSIDADQLTITLEDARSGRLWQVTDGRLQLEQTDKVVDITVSFDVFNQTEELAETVLGFRSAKGSSEASLGATFRNAAAADIAAQSPVLAFLAVVDAPISGALRTAIDAEGNLSDLVGTLEIGTGALSPAPGARPVKFDGGKVYLDYDPIADRVDFTEISVTSELGMARGEGHAYLRDYANGWPGSLLGQFTITRAQLNPRGWFETPVELKQGAVDFRLRLDPFTVDIGQLVARHRDTTFRGSGEISADRDGWWLALDATADRLQRDQVLALWPTTLSPKPRTWVAENVIAGTAHDAHVAFRMVPDQAPHISVGAALQGATVRPVKAMVLIEDMSGYLSIEDQTFTAVAEGGYLTAPSGDRVAVAGTSFTIPHMPAKPTPAVARLAVSGPVRGVLSVLDAKPFEIFKDGDFGPDLATGQAVATGRLNIEMQEQMDPKDIRFDVVAELHDLRSDKLIPDRVLVAPSAKVHVTHDGIEISGDGRVGSVAAGGSWRMGMGAKAEDRSQLDGWVELSQTFLDEFNIGLPDGTVAGKGIGRITLDLPKSGAPAFRLQSDLNRLQLSASALGWSKPANLTGSLEVEGVLGEVARIDRIAFDAPGLSATGKVALTPEGQLDRASFDRVRVGGWLDAPVAFVGRGKDQNAGIVVSGGSADMRRAEFSSGDGGGGGDAPINLTLDRLTISEGIVLTSFDGEFNRRGGLNGKFTALVKGGAAIRGALAPQPAGSAFRITSKDAGAVLRGAGVFDTARGGNLELILTPREGEGIYEGDLKITDTRVVGAPAMAELLSAISVVGLLEQLDGDGLAFGTVDARFRLTPTLVTLYRSSAIGHSLGISLDGYYDLRNSNMDMQGVLSPFYIVNSIGQAFTRRGEGLVGFNFTLKGSPGDPKVGVNPLSILTPGMFRDIFRRQPPKPQD